MGEVSVLFPEGIDRLDDLPWTFQTAITTGLAYLSFEELPKDERPPKRIWDRPDEMTAWWKMIERQRDEKYGGSGGDSSAAGTHEEKNDMTKDLIVG